jgi:hypothetical protein
VRLLVNGVRFDIRVHIVRDLRELAGAHGGWSCSSQLGIPTLNPGVSLLRTDVTAVLDSVAYGRDGFRYKFYFDMRWSDRYSDGTTGSGEAPETRNVLSQNAGGWFWAYGPWMNQTGTAPLSYVQTSELECDAWSTSGPMVNEPFWLTK